MNKKIKSKSFICNLRVDESLLRSQSAEDRQTEREEREREPVAPCTLT